MRGRLGMAIVAAALAALPARAEPLVADISKHRITIDSSFTGTDVLLFGAIDEKGDLVIVVRGPEE
ncbi:MAG: TIGR02186 family protein, partial [Alphaproteobacteria bacterium]